MKKLLILSLLLFFFGAAFAQTAPQAVAIVISPDMAAFASMSPRPDFSTDLIIKIKVTDVSQLYKIQITCADSSIKLAPSYVTLPTLGWQNFGTGLATGCKLPPTGGVTIQAMAASGSPVPLPTAQ